MLLLNFAHPLTEEHLKQIEAMTGRSMEHIVDIPTHIDAQQPLSPQVMALADQIGLSATEWQILPLLINPPRNGWRSTLILSLFI